MSKSKQVQPIASDKAEAALPERALDHVAGGAVFPSSPSTQIHPDLVRPAEGALLPAVKPIA
jgi:hypothetical protein